MKKLIVILAMGLLPLISLAEDPIQIIVLGNFEAVPTPYGYVFTCWPPYPDNICLWITVSGSSAIITDGAGKTYNFKAEYSITEDSMGNKVYTFEDVDD